LEAHTDSNFQGNSIINLGLHVKVKNQLDVTKYAEDVARLSLATSSEQCSLQEPQCGTTQVAFQLWPPKSGRYSLIVLLMMAILVPETC
jgi:hypothetical protein